MFCEQGPELIEAYHLAHKIEECFQKHNVLIKISKRDYNPCCGDGFKFIVKLKGSTRIDQVEKLIPTARVALKLKHLRCVQDDDILYLATFTPQALEWKHLSYSHGRHALGSRAQ